MLPWELDWARIGDGGSSKRCRSANAVHTVVSMDAGRPVLFGSSLSGWLETMRLHGASKPVAFALLRKLFEVKAQAKWSSTKLPEGNDVDVKDAIITRLYGLVGLSGGLKVTQSVEGGNRRNPNSGGPTAATNFAVRGTGPGTGPGRGGTAYGTV